jgi:cytochrome c553
MTPTGRACRSVGAAFLATVALAAPRVPLASVAAAAGLALASAVASAAPFEDTMAQRTLACTGCHGPEGRAAPDGYYPRIAGKPSGYLYNQLLNFRDGRRQYALMSGLLAPLNDAYLAEIAAHFARLEVPYPPPAQAPGADAAVAAQLVRDGDRARDLPACNACHGTAMTGVRPFVPGLLGLPRDYVTAQIGAWRTGKRRAQAPDCMHDVAMKLTPEEVVAISSWLAAQPAGAPPAEAFAAPPPLACGGVAPGAPR